MTRGDRPPKEAAKPGAGDAPILTAEEKQAFRE